jgi:alkylated DNA repair dioxygenase AlkB
MRQEALRTTIKWSVFPILPPIDSRILRFAECRKRSTHPDPQMSPMQTYDGLTSVASLGLGDTSYHVNCFTPAETAAFFDHLCNDIEYVGRDHPGLQFHMFGKAVQLPRDKAFFGDVDANGVTPLYRYGATEYPEVRPWPPMLALIRDLCDAAIGHTQHSNHTVVNHYAHGNDYIGYHRDKTPDWVAGTSVLTASFGAPRKFRLQPIKGKAAAGQPTIEIVLQPGSIFVLGFRTNELYKHSIVKQSANVVPRPRVSVTLRSIKTRVDPRDGGRVFEVNAEEIERQRGEAAATKRSGGVGGCVGAIESGAVGGGGGGGVGGAQGGGTETAVTEKPMLVLPLPKPMRVLPPTVAAGKLVRMTSTGKPMLI